MYFVVATYINVADGQGSGVTKSAFLKKFLYFLLIFVLKHLDEFFMHEIFYQNI